MDPYLGKSHFFSKKLGFGLTLTPRLRTTTFDYSAKFEIFDFFFGKFWYKKLTLRWKFRKKCTPRGENWRKFTPLGENFKKWWFFFKNLRLGWRWRHDGGLFSKIWNISIFSGNFEKKTDPGGENFKKIDPPGDFFLQKLAFRLTLTPRWRTTTFDYSAKLFNFFGKFW